MSNSTRLRAAHFRLRWSFGGEVGEQALTIPQSQALTIPQSVPIVLARLASQVSGRYQSWLRCVQREAVMMIGHANSEKLAVHV